MPEQTKTDSTKTASENTGTTEKAKVEAPEPNIIFVGKKLVDAQTRIHNGLQKIILPKVEEQVTVTTEKVEKDGATEDVEVIDAIPFYHKDASTIIRVFPGLYKAFVKKGK